MSLDSVSIFPIVKWIGSLAIEQGQFINDIPEEVYDLQIDLQYMLQQLEELDIDSGNLNRSQHSFAEEIRKFAFRSEDIVDYYLANLQPKIEDNKSACMKLSCILSNCSPIYQVGNEIHAIRKQLKAANERLKNFSVARRGDRRGKRPYSDTEMLRNAPAKALHVEDDFVVGIKDDISKIVAQLLRNENSSSTSRFVAIVGTGGAGKTTLARKIFGNVDIQGHFDTRVLVSISREWRPKEVLTEIARQAMGMKGRDTIVQTEVAIKEELRGFFKNRRYMIIIDDIWELRAWNDISYAFPKSHGSKIILTTRNRDVPLSIDRSSFIHEPHLLDREDIYELIHKLAIEDRSITDTAGMKEFETLAWDMSGKFSGLPLSAVSLAGALRVKNELYQWEAVQKNLARCVALGRGNNNYGVVEDMLALSYFDLPSYLKPCLLYLASFPEDFAISTGWLIRMWVGEGFVSTKDVYSEQETLEEAGIRFLDELINWCLLIVTKRNYQGKVKKVKVHGLVRDFCKVKAEQQCFIKAISFVDENKKPSREDTETMSQARRIVAVYAPSNWEMHAPQVPQPTLSLPGLRTWKRKDKKDRMEISTTQGVRSLTQIYGSQRALVLRLTHNNFRLLRVLNVLKVKRVTLPDEFGSLLHLRYMRFYCCSFSQPIPPSIKRLRNLLTFDLRRCDYVSLPENLFERMEHLRYVYCSTRLRNGEALGLEKSDCLQVLSRMRSGAWVVKEVPWLSSSLIKLEIINICSQSEMDAIFQCPSLAYNHLRSLSLQSIPMSCTVNLRKLEHCCQLRKLCLDEVSVEGGGNHCMGGRFPPNLVKLRLSHCRMKAEILEAVGELDYLKNLELEKSHPRNQEWVFKPNSFLQLEYLNFGEDRIVFQVGEEEQQQGGSVLLLPCLKKLKIGWIKCFPKGLQKVTTLQELHIRKLVYEEWKRDNNVSDHDQEKITTTTTTTTSQEADDIQNFLKKIPTVNFFLT